MGWTIDPVRWYVVHLWGRQWPAIVDRTGDATGRGTIVEIEDR